MGTRKKGSKKKAPRSTAKKIKKAPKKATNESEDAAEDEAEMPPAAQWRQDAGLTVFPSPPQSGFLAMGAPIPPHYGEDRMGCLVRDPHWIHCYWELEGGICQRIADERGQDFMDACRWVIRAISSEGSVRDTRIDILARSRRIRVNPKTRYRVELGLVSPDGEYVKLIAGDEIETPPESPDLFTGLLSEQPEQQIEEMMELITVSSSPAGAFETPVKSKPKAHSAPERISGSKTDKPNVTGQLVFVFHSHLPYVRHPEHERFLEEEWLFEAITETYVPIAKMLLDLDGEESHARAAIGMSPPLCEMLSDSVLQKKYRAQLDRLIQCADRALEQMRDSDFQEVAQMYCERLRSVGALYDKWDRNPLNPLRDLQRKGVVEIITCAATHGLLPLMRKDESVRAQIEIGCRNYEKHFEVRPAGMWLPESAYHPKLDSFLVDCGIEYVFLESHGVLFSTPQPSFLTYRPIVTPGGIAAFARDPYTGVRVWSSERGYPGDPAYREFYRDIGYDGDFETVKDCLEPDGRRRNIGLKYHRITGRVPLNKKEPYVPHKAARTAQRDANDFVDQCESRMRELSGSMDAAPVICAMYDTELYGHWWYEGIDFLREVYRRINASDGILRTTTPSEVLAQNETLQRVAPCASTWGVKGYYEHWVNPSNSWIYPHLHKAEDRMIEMVHRFPDAHGLQQRALNQAARELLLAQASDWAFLIAARTAPEYATRRTRDHVAQFTRIYEMALSGRIDEKELEQIEMRDSIFPEIDYKVYAP